MDAVVVIELDLVLGGVIVEPPVDMLPIAVVLLLLGALVVALLDAVGACTGNRSTGCGWSTWYRGHSLLYFHVICSAPP